MAKRKEIVLVPKPNQSDHFNINHVLEGFGIMRTCWSNTNTRWSSLKARCVSYRGVTAAQSMCETGGVPL